MNTTKDKQYIIVYYAINKLLLDNNYNDMRYKLINNCLHLITNMRIK